MQRDASPDERARRLIAALTLDQKISQLHGDSQPHDYRIVPGIPNLCIPDLTVTNGPAGVGTSYEKLNGTPATALPAPIALASTWDPAMATTFGNVIGAEMQETGRNVLEAPDVDLARVPYNGRTFEAFGEDPYLASTVAVPEIRSVQARGIVAMAKHFVANNQEQDRTTVDARVSERALNELYYPPFEAAVEQANVASVMCSYNQVNGMHSCENSPLLQDVLREQWGFAGYVQSDFSAAHSTVPSVQAGLDLEMPNGHYYSDPLHAAVQTGAVTESQLDTMLERRYTQMFKLGLFDRKVTTSPIPVDEHAASAQQIAEAGTVLLRNAGGTLPIDTSRVHSIAVVGPWADRAATGGGGSSKVNAIRTVTPVAGITARAGKSLRVVAAPGSNVHSAVSAASKADMAIVVVGEQLSEGTDRTSLSLPDDQDAFIAAVAAANPNTVVVVHAGAPVLMPWLDRVSAVVLGWYPGQEDGTVTARILFGDAEPGGRLPITFPAQESDLPTSTTEQYPGVDGVENYSEDLEVGYRHYLAKGITPLFPFGFGLSYSTFTIDDLQAPADVTAGQPVTVTARVTNTGTRTASEVAQVYVESPASAGEPSPTLQGFAKVTLDPGSSQTVTITLAARAFEHWDDGTHAWVASVGTATLHVGTSSADTPLTAPVQVHG
jgi:beta-glucosidase